MTTFFEMIKIMQENGWEQLSPQEYRLEKFKKKHNTARIGDSLFFKLKELTLKEKLWKEGKSASEFPKDWIVVPVLDVIKIMENEK
jgi:hypothetical protein